MSHTKLLSFVMVLVVPIAALAAQKQCGAESCGSPVKSQKTINGVVHNCESTTCSKSCCTLADPPVCSVEKTTTSSCTPARVAPGKQIQKYKAPPATTKQQ